MVQFELRKPIQTRSPTIEVDPGLAPGSYRFSLVVTDENGNESEPDFQTVVIQQPPIRDSIRDAVSDPNVRRDLELNRARITESLRDRMRDRFPN